MAAKRKQWPDDVKAAAIDYRKTHSGAETAKHFKTNEKNVSRWVKAAGKKSAKKRVKAELDSTMASHGFEAHVVMLAQNALKLLTKDGLPTEGALDRFTERLKVIVEVLESRE